MTQLSELIESTIYTFNCEFTIADVSKIVRGITGKKDTVLLDNKIRYQLNKYEFTKYIKSNTNTNVYRPKEVITMSKQDISIGINCHRNKHDISIQDPRVRSQIEAMVVSKNYEALLTIHGWEYVVKIIRINHSRQFANCIMDFLREECTTGVWVITITDSDSEVENHVYKEFFTSSRDAQSKCIKLIEELTSEDITLQWQWDKEMKEATSSNEFLFFTINKLTKGG